MKPFQPIGFSNTGYVKPVESPKLSEAVVPEQASSIPVAFSTDISPFKETQNVFMQAQQPSCVGHGVTWAVMYHYWKKTGKYVKLSPRFVYAMCKTTDGLPVDAGTYLATALQVLKDHGVCEDSFFPNNTDLDVSTYANPALISAEAKQNALQYRIDDFEFLKNLSPQSLNTAIYNGGKGDVVVTGMDVSSWWWTDVNGRTTWSADSLLPLRPIDAAHPEISGHCTALYAYGEEWDSQYPINYWGMNWWSPEWAYQGRYCLGNNDLPNIYEAATITAEFSNTQPAPVISDVSHENLTVAEEIVEWVEKVVEDAKEAL